jgi:hypothetical protein
MSREGSFRRRRLLEASSKPLTDDEIALGTEAILFAETLLPLAVEKTSQPRVALVGFVLAASKLAVVFAKQGQPNARAEFIRQAGAAFDDEWAKRGG